MLFVYLTQELQKLNFPYRACLGLVERTRFEGVSDDAVSALWMLIGGQCRHWHLRTTVASLPVSTMYHLDRTVSARPIPASSSGHEACRAKTYQEMDNCGLFEQHPAFAIDTSQASPHFSTCIQDGT